MGCCHGFALVCHGCEEVCCVCVCVCVCLCAEVGFVGVVSRSVVLHGGVSHFQAYCCDVYYHGEICTWFCF